MKSKILYHSLKAKLYAWLLLVVFFASAFSSISIELCHQIMHIPDYLKQSVSMHDRSHIQQDHSHVWLTQNTNQDSKDQLKESNNPLKLQLVNPSQLNTKSILRAKERQAIIYNLIFTSETGDIPVPPPLFS